MYELFLTAVVPSQDFSKACSVLQGICAMTAWQSLHRVLLFTGPPEPRGLPRARQLVKTPPYGQKWAELNQHFSRQSYFVQARYEVDRSRHMGSPSPMDLNSTPGILRWTDLPDPSNNYQVMQRKVVEIPDQPGLLRNMIENNLRFKNELVEESYSYYWEGIEYQLVRQYKLNDDVAIPQQPLATLPALEALELVDPSGRWFLHVKKIVMEDNAPEQLKKAQGELMGIVDQFDGVFEFRSFDRRIFDTRVAQHVSNMPMPLPQKVSVGGKK